MLRPAKRAPLPQAPRVFDAQDVVPAPSSLRERLEQMRARYHGVHATTLLEAAIFDEFPGRVATVSSFGSESVVLLHLISQIDPTVPVIFLNTGKLFGETLRYRDRIQAKLGLTDLRSVGPHPGDERVLDPDGTLWSRDPDACCNFRKVLPLRRSLAGFDAEITGRKRFQTVARSSMGPIELNGSRFVINPLHGWSLADLVAHIEKYDLPRHPLVADGFLSIGCMPCTQRVKTGEDYRSGRWAGSDKDECGIHENVEGDGI
ncbi:MAG: phosphoadenylyl-sulfate reductase [Alphaproteobacteria bacterium]|nr:phosphoadenylyl-sulfate reductase [Alphaproteobacteria bacterium]